MKKLLVFLVMFGVLMMGIGSVMAAPTFTDVGFQYSTDGTTWTPMSGNLSHGFVLPTNGSSLTTYLISYKNATTATDFGNGPFGLYLTSTTVPISTLHTYYDSKSEPYKTYLNNALLIGNVTNQTPFAYISGPTGSLKLQDAAQWDVNAQTLAPMVIPGDYPKGMYVVEGDVEGTHVIYKLIIGQALEGSATVTVIEGTVDVIISPLLITFGNLLPGTVNATAKSGDVTISASTTNANNLGVHIEVDVSEGLFKNNLFFGDVLADNYVVELPCLSGDICTYTPVTFLPTLTVPLGTTKGFDSAVITYTITGPAPTD